MCVTTLVPSGSRIARLDSTGPIAYRFWRPVCPQSSKFPSSVPKTDFIDYGVGVSGRAHARALTFRFIEHPLSAVAVKLEQNPIGS